VVRVREQQLLPDEIVLIDRDKTHRSGHEQTVEGDRLLVDRNVSLLRVNNVVALCKGAQYANRAGREARRKSASERTRKRASAKHIIMGKQVDVVTLGTKMLCKLQLDPRTSELTYRREVHHHQNAKRPTIDRLRVAGAVSRS
jgi:hypothetical protein